MGIGRNRTLSHVLARKFRLVLIDASAFRLMRLLIMRYTGPFFQVRHPTCLQ
jgi:hypothetical protein